MGSILIVDDERLEVPPNKVVYLADQNAALLRRSNQTHSHEILVAYDVKQAVALIHKKAVVKSPFDVIITDMRMPIDTSTNPALDPRAGLQIVRVARNSDLFTQVIAITAFSHASLAYEAMSMGAMYFDKQWLEPKIFPAVIQTHIDEVKRRRTHFDEMYQATCERNKLQQKAFESDKAWLSALHLVYNNKDVLGNLRAVKDQVLQLNPGRERTQALATLKKCTEDLESFFQTIAKGFADL